MVRACLDPSDEMVLVRALPRRGRYLIGNARCPTVFRLVLAPPGFGATLKTVFLSVVMASVFLTIRHPHFFEFFLLFALIFNPWWFIHSH